MTDIAKNVRGFVSAIENLRLMIGDAGRNKHKVGEYEEKIAGYQRRVDALLSMLRAETNTWSRQCRCGEEKEAWQIGCKKCWGLLPKRLRDVVFVARNTDRGGVAHLLAIADCLAYLEKAETALDTVNTVTRFILAKVRGSPMTEPLASTPRVNITESVTPAPPWSGVKFTCEKCQGEFQLEAADHCDLRLVLNDHLHTYNVPPCRTEGCGHVNAITIEEDQPLTENERLHQDEF